jgi:hypothetical protein
MVSVRNSPLTMLTHGDVLLVWVANLLLPLDDGFGVCLRIDMTDVGVVGVHADVALLLRQRHVARVPIHNEPLFLCKAFLIVSTTLEDPLSSSHEHILLSEIAVQGQLVL